MIIKKNCCHSNVNENNKHITFQYVTLLWHRKSKQWTTKQLEAEIITPCSQLLHAVRCVERLKQAYQHKTLNPRR